MRQPMSLCLLALVRRRTTKQTNGGDPANILTNPGDFYVNVHNDEYPAGAIRGQLEAL